MKEVELEEVVMEEEEAAGVDGEQDPSFGSSSIDVGSSSGSRSKVEEEEEEEEDTAVLLCEACGSGDASWYCAADDAYLCQSCDESVHAANAVAHRHERTVCRKRARRSSSSCKERCKSNKTIKLDAHLLPRTEEEEEEGEEAEDEEELLNEEEDEGVHRVPVLHQNRGQGLLSGGGDEHSPDSGVVDGDGAGGGEAAEAAELAATEEGEIVDIERFLNSAAEYDEDEAACGGEGGVGGSSFALGGGGEGILDFLGFADDRRGAGGEYFDEEFAIRKEHSPYVKVEANGGGGDGFEDSSSRLFAPQHSLLQPPPPLPKHEERVGFRSERGFDDEEDEDEERWRQMHESHAQRRIWLRLDYDEVLNAWPGRRPFIDLQRQQPLAPKKKQAKAESLLHDDSTSDIAGSSDVGVVPELSSSSAGGGHCVDQQSGRVPVVSSAAAAAMAEDGGGGREARVSRYREKRRTRLFSKKIRYEVRKLNAERRPRLKGRFVKRSPGN